LYSSGYDLSEWIKWVALATPTLLLHTDPDLSLRSLRNFFVVFVAVDLGGDTSDNDFALVVVRAESGGEDDNDGDDDDAIGDSSIPSSCHLSLDMVVLWMSPSVIKQEWAIQVPEQFSRPNRSLGKEFVAVTDAGVKIG
jgi:hypothetical protein